MNTGSDFETFIFICPHCQYQTRLPEAFEGLMHTCENCKVKSVATATTEKICPSCGKPVDISAKKCHHCQQDFIDISILLKKLESDLGIKMIEIPAGSFMMGSPESEVGRFADELLHHETVEKKFWMSETPITKSQYKKVTGKTRGWAGISGNVEYPNYPVSCVDWDEADQYCRLLNEKYADYIPCNVQFDLPTEIQWEYSCRAGTTSPLYNGKSLKKTFFDFEKDCIADIAQYGMFSGPQQVKKKKPNNWGLYDMVGNVYEWCRDNYYLYPGDNNIDNIQKCADLLLKDRKIIRGGCWELTPISCSVSACRSAAREAKVPSFRDDLTGFRIILEEK